MSIPHICTLKSMLTTPREEPALLRSAPPGPHGQASRPAWLSRPVPCLKSSGLCLHSQVSVVQTPLRSLGQGGELQGPFSPTVQARPPGVQDRSTRTPFQEPPLPREKVQLGWGDLTTSPGDPAKQQPGDPKASSVDAREAGVGDAQHRLIHHQRLLLCAQATPPRS